MNLNHGLINDASESFLPFSTYSESENILPMKQKLIFTR